MYGRYREQCVYKGPKGGLFYFRRGRDGLIKKRYVPHHERHKIVVESWWDWILPKLGLGILNW